MMNWRGCGRKGSWPVLYHPDIGLKRVTEEAMMDHCHKNLCSAEIRTGYLPITSWNRYVYQLYGNNCDKTRV